MPTTLGGTIGYNWQALGSPWVFGLEGDIDWTNIKGTFTSVTCPTGCQTKNTWLHAVASATPGIA
jgi:outer membrane immunogenic protein